MKCFVIKAHSRISRIAQRHPTYTMVANVMSKGFNIFLMIISNGNSVFSRFVFLTSFAYSSNFYAPNISNKLSTGSLCNLPVSM